MKQIRKGVTLLGSIGLVESTALSFQPGATTALCQNYRSHEPSTDRDRGAMRAGLTRLTSSRLGGGAIQEINSLVVSITVD